jgi:hypothetical protein
MTVWKVLELVEPEESEEHLRSWFIEFPREWHEGDLYTMGIKGWVIGRNARATAVETVYHDHVIRTDPVRGPRADLAPAFPDLPPDLDMHFHSLLGVVGLRPEFKLLVQAVLDDGRRVPMAHIRATHEPVRSGYEPLIRPLMLTCLGRSGTTWMMRMLASHPEIVVYDRHPYEGTFAKYWMHMVRVLSQPADMIDSYEPETFHNEIWHLGYNPFYDIGLSREPISHDWFGREHVERLARFCQSNIDSWYTTVARAQGQPPPTYFAEKHQWPNYIPVLTWELYPNAKEIFLVRDFRDMVFSILAFDRKRGFAGFGRPEGRSEEDYVRMELRDMARHLRKSWVTRRDRAHLVRYEDLVFRPNETVRGFLEYLELDASPASVERALANGTEETAELNAHRTSSKAEESIGRWRREGDDHLRELCNDVFGEILEEFGYSEVGYVG